MTITLGKQLQQIRESKGLSLEEISQKTHIKVPYLKALEEGKVEVLPSPTHLRGFLRLYAATLGVELDALISSSNHSVMVAEVEESTEPSKQGEVINKEKIQGLPSEKKQPPRLFLKFKEFLQKPKKARAKVAKPESRPLQEMREETKSLSSGAIFTAIGKQLQQRRNLISLSLDDVESQTHIRKRFLSDIESGQFDRLPSPVQARGMLANYAGFLSLDIDSILLDFADGLQKKRLENIVSPPEKKEAKEISPSQLRLKNFFSLDLFVIAAIFFVFAGFVIWGVNRILSTDTPTTAPTDLPDVSDVLLATGSPTPDFLQTPEETQTVEETTVGQADEAATTIPTSISSSSAISIMVIPIRNVWIKVTADGEVVYEGRVLAGSAYDYYADERLELLTGSAGALQVLFNDQDIGSIGLIGQVSTLVFTPNGLALPTPTASPTPTMTPQETSTPTVTPTPSPTGN